MSIVDSLIEFLHSLMALPLFYPLVTVLIIGDALCPLIPSETVLNLSGAFSASQGVPNFRGVFAAAVVGGIIGDNLCFALGGKLIGYVENLNPASKAGQAITWVRRNMKRGAGITIIVGRFLPWVRWVATIVLGSVQYSWGAFFIYDTAGVLIWSLIGVGAGYVGGALLANYPFLAMLAGILLGSLVGFAIQRAQAWFSEWRDVNRGESVI